MTNHFTKILRHLKAKHGLTAQEMTIVARYVTGKDDVSIDFLTDEKAHQVANELTANDKYTIYQRIANYQKEHA